MEPVSKELFTSEVKNIKAGMSDVKSDIRDLKDTINDLTTAINSIKLTHVENTGRISHLEDTVIKAGDSLKKVSDVLDKVNNKVNEIDKRVDAIEKYPTYTKWTLGIILTGLLIWKAIKEHIL